MEKKESQLIKNRFVCDVKKKLVAFFLNILMKGIFFSCLIKINVEIKFVIIFL